MLYITCFISFFLFTFKHRLFKNVLFNFHIFINLSVFLLLLISILYHGVHNNKYLYNFYNFIFLLLILWLNIWSILKNVPSLLENNVYLNTMGWSVPYMSIRCIWFVVLLKSAYSTLIFLCRWSIIENGILKFPTTTMLLLFLLLVMLLFALYV